MYWYYKLALVLIVTGLLAGGFYTFRDSLPLDRVSKILSSDEETSGSTTANTTSTDIPSNGDPIQTSQKPVIDITPQDLSLTLSKANDYLTAENYDKAIETSRSVLRDPRTKMFSKAWQDAADTIGKANTVLAATSAPSKFKSVHIVKPNDSLSAIARRKTTVRLLQRCNNISPDSHIIRPNQKIFYFEGPWRLEAYKSQFTLVVYHKDELFKTYKIGIGMQNRTPETAFTILGKVTNPDWAPPGQPLIPFGDERNVLGTRWMELHTTETDYADRGFGIHGTTQPDSIGTPSSQGCIRMRNNEVEELYDFLPDGGVVEVKIKE